MMQIILNWCSAHPGIVFAVAAIALCSVLLPNGGSGADFDHDFCGSDCAGD